MIFAHRMRFLSAYALAFRVMGSYFAFYFFGKLGLRSDGDADWAALHGRNARRMVATLSALKGIYIKVGQSLSIMSNFLPEAMTREFESLQDQAPPTPFPAIAAELARVFKKPVASIFARFDETPIASASLGQVHRATLASGEDVAVKVQHPDVRPLVKRDLRTLRRIFRLFHWAFPRYGLDAVYEECAKMVQQELDFRAEGKASESIAENLRDLPWVRIPRVYWDYTSETVLTAAFVKGVKITALQALDEAGIDRRLAAERLLTAYCRQLFENGFYHADPHPGNILVEPGPDLVFLDFGAVVRISPQMRQGIIRFAEGLIRKDTALLTKALRDMGFVARRESDTAVERIVEHFYQKVSEIEFENFKDLQKLDTLAKVLNPSQINFSLRELATAFHIPREWILLERTLLLIFGICGQLDPTLNPMQIALPYVETFVLGKDRHFYDVAVQTIKDAGTSYLTLGVELRRLLRKMERGEFSAPVVLAPGSLRPLVRAVNSLSAILAFAFSGFFLYEGLVALEGAALRPVFIGVSAAFAAAGFMLAVRGPRP